MSDGQGNKKAIDFIFCVFNIAQQKEEDYAARHYRTDKGTDPL